MLYCQWQPTFLHIRLLRRAGTSKRGRWVGVLESRAVNLVLGVVWWETFWNRSLFGEADSEGSEEKTYVEGEGTSLGCHLAQTGALATLKVA
jgi:hypothetical protein